MLKSIFLIFIFQLAGEVVQQFFLLTIPGPVIGLILLLITLLLIRHFNFSFKAKIESDLSISAEYLVSHLPLLFVPIGVGVILHISYLENSLLSVFAVIFIGTLLTLGFTAFVMEKIQNSGSEK